MRLEIAKADLAAIGAAAVAAYPEECCGLLVGSSAGGGWRVERIVPAANVATEPARHFEVDPATLLAAHREAREAGLSVIGHYHSHPNGRAAPSDHDRARAAESGAAGEVWLVVPVSTEGAGAAGANVFEAGDFRAIAIAEPS